MSITVVGISHKTAKLDIRGLFQFSPAVLDSALNDCCAKTNSAEVLILSTCNRIEVYCDTNNPESVIKWLHQFHGVSADHSQYFYTYTDTQALKHAIRVASSLDSLVMGEPQILGQFKAAHHVAMQNGCIGYHLSQVFKAVLNTAKRIRHETRIGHCPVSVAYSALQMCDTQKLQDAAVLVLGAGDTAKRMLKHLAESGVNNITILNRSLDNAKKLAENCNAAFGTLDLIQNHLASTDVIIGAVQTEQPLISEGMLSNTNHPILCIDISAPRSIEATAAQLSNVELISIDDIDAYISHNTQLRAKAADMAERIVEHAVSEYITDQNARSAVPTIVALRETADTIIEEEFAKSLSALKRGEDPETVLGEFAYKLKQKWLHSPSKAIHSAAKDGDEQFLSLTKRLFKL